MRAASSAAAPLKCLVASAEEICRDTRLSPIRRWKERTGGLAIGFMPIHVPRELLHAQGVLPVGLMGGGDVEIIRGDAYYQSYICHIPRSTIELGLAGAYDCLDGVIFPAICDVIRNLSGIWRMEFPHLLVRYLDVPQNFDPELGGRFYRDALEELSGALEARGARPLDDDALRASIALYNDHRRRVEGLYALRREQPWLVPTSELYQILRAGQVLPVEDHIRMLDDYRDGVKHDAARRPMDHSRVALTGSFCEQPPLGLILTLERSGCYIVEDDLVLTHRWIEGDVATEGDPLGNLVDAFLNQSASSPTRYIGDGRPGEALVRRVKQSGAEGVIFCAPSFCDPALLDQPMAVKAIEAAGIPWTAFKYAENNGQFQVIREQAGTFSDSIKLWSPA